MKHPETNNPLIQLDKNLDSLDREIRRKKWVSTVYIILRILVIVVMVLQFFNQNYENVFLCILTLFLFLLPTVAERRFQIDLPNTLEIIILVFIFAAEILGEIASFYTMYQGWDTILHTINGFLCAAVGFCLVDMLNRNEKFSLSLSPLFLSLVAFCFSMTIGVLWEFFEWAMDTIFFLDMQKDYVVTTISSVRLDPTGMNTPVQITGITDVILVTAEGEIPLGIDGYLDIGLIDTMKDMLVNLIGAVIFSVVGYFYVKTRGEGEIAKHFIPTVLPDGQEQEDGSV